MKKFFRKLKNKTNCAILGIKIVAESKKAEGYVDTGVKILIAVVLGALLLGLLYTLLNTTVMGSVSTKITELFSYSGS